jgi:small neutral amino acid transporter SnatA (MarC family)
MSVRQFGWLAAWTTGLVSLVAAWAAVWLVLIEPTAIARAAGDGGLAVLNAMLATLEAGVLRVFGSL